LTPILASDWTKEGEENVEDHCDLNCPDNWKIKLAFFSKIDIYLCLESSDCLLTTELILQE